MRVKIKRAYQNESIWIYLNPRIPDLDLDQRIPRGESNHCNKPGIWEGASSASAKAVWGAGAEESDDNDCADTELLGSSSDAVVPALALPNTESWAAACGSRLEGWCSSAA